MEACVPVMRIRGSTRQRSMAIAIGRIERRGKGGARAQAYSKPQYSVARQTNETNKRIITRPGRAWESRGHKGARITNVRLPKPTRGVAMFLLSYSSCFYFSMIFRGCRSAIPRFLSPFRLDRVARSLSLAVICALAIFQRGPSLSCSRRPSVQEEEEEEAS